MNFKTIYYEPDVLEYELGKRLKQQYTDADWRPIESHNSIKELQAKPNSEFPTLKQLLILGTRKTHVYQKNAKVSDFLVPFTSSGCTASCLYCYLVCNYNKCSYLRVFVNREQMLDKLIRTAKKNETDLTFEIGSNSDLILENTITDNLDWVIPEFGRQEKGYITFPTKFSMVEPLLPLEHKGRTSVRMSVNPQKIIAEIERGTASLKERIEAMNRLAEAGYQVGMLIAPIVLVDNWKSLYTDLIEQLAAGLSVKVKKQLVIEIIFMTYSYIHRAINREAFPEATELYDKALMTGRGRGRYTYKQEARVEGERLLRSEIEKHFGPDSILYVV